MEETWWDRRRVLPSHGCMRSCSWLLLGPSSCLVWMASGYISTQPCKLNEAYIMQIRDRERERGEVWRRVITEQPCVVLLVEATEGDVSIFLCENLALLRERKETFYDYLLKIDQLYFLIYNPDVMFEIPWCDMAQGFYIWTDSMKTWE